MPIANETESGLALLTVELPSGYLADIHTITELTVNNYTILLINTLEYSNLIFYFSCTIKNFHVKYISISRKRSFVLSRTS